MFVGLGWTKKIRSIGYPHVPYKPPPDRDIGAAKRYCDDYEMTRFLQSIQIWKWKVEEERQRYVF